jgi:hypothetical protein
MEDLSRKGEERPMPAINSFMPLYSSDDSQVKNMLDTFERNVFYVRKRCLRL